MKTKKLKLLSVFMLLIPLFVVLLGAGCEDDEAEGEWSQIDSIMPDTQLSIQLSSIFSENNDCLKAFQNDTVYIVLYSQKELAEIDTCNIIPDIDFDEYTLIVGKVKVPGMVSSISNITLLHSDPKNRYKLEIVVDDCEECYTAIGYLFFWRLYPKLETGHDFELFINKK